MLCSLAIRRTRGELRTFSAPLPCDCAPLRACCGALAAGAGPGGNFFSDGGAATSPCGAAGLAAAGAGAEAAGAGAATAAPSDAITPTTVWIGTVCPSPTLISCRMPEAGDGISASTLSVEISNSGSSRSIFSPGFFSHLVTVPSKMLSPICGMMTFTDMFYLPVAFNILPVFAPQPQCHSGSATTALRAAVHTAPEYPAQ